MACPEAVMAANGGTARTLVTDNMSSIVSSSAWRRVSARPCQARPPAGFELELARPRSPQDQGQGGVVEPVPVEAGCLRGRLPRRGGARGRHRAHRGAVQHRAQRVDWCRRRCCSCARRRSCARWATWGFWSRWWPTSPSRRRPTMPSAAGAASSVPRRCIGRRVKVLEMPSGQVRVEMAGETVAVHDLSAPREGPSSTTRHYAEALGREGVATPTPTSRRRPAPT